MPQTHIMRLREPEPRMVDDKLHIVEALFRRSPKRQFEIAGRRAALLLISAALLSGISPGQVPTVTQLPYVLTDQAGVVRVVSSSLVRTPPQVQQSGLSGLLGGGFGAIGEASGITGEEAAALAIEKVYKATIEKKAEDLVKEYDLQASDVRNQLQNQACPVNNTRFGVVTLAPLLQAPGTAGLQAPGPVVPSGEGARLRQAARLRLARSRAAVGMSAAATTTWKQPADGPGGWREAARLRIAAKLRAAGGTAGLQALGGTAVLLGNGGPVGSKALGSTVGFQSLRSRLGLPATGSTAGFQSMSSRLGLPSTVSLVGLQPNDTGCGNENESDEQLEQDVETQENQNVNEASEASEQAEQAAETLEQSESATQDAIEAAESAVEAAEAAAEAAEEAAEIAIESAEVLESFLELLSLF